MSRRSRPGSGRITLGDVAGHVGVSKITVSRALRQPDKVADPLRQRILDAIDALGYIPNRQAGSLASARTHAIALLVPSLSNGVFSDVLRGVDDIVQDTGYQVLLGHSGYSLLEEEHLVSTYLGYGVEGFILPSGQHTERTLSLLSRSGLPVVEIMGLSASPVDMSVGLDHLPDTPLTRGYIDYRLLGCLPTGAIVINIGRGTTLVLDDLMARLDEGHLRGAVLDVFSEEPLDADHPIRGYDNVLITPHISGPTPIRGAIDQLVSYLQAIGRRDFSDAVSREAGY